MAGIIWNTKDFDDKMEKMDKEVVRTAKKIRMDVALDIRQKSVDVAPKDKGVLRQNSGTRDFPNYSEVFYGGMASQYAIYQHEGMRADGTHVVKNYTTPGTGRKFLENTILENLPEYRKKFGMIITEMNI